MSAPTTAPAPIPAIAAWTCPKCGRALHVVIRDESWLVMRCDHCKRDVERVRQLPQQSAA